ncbi:Sulfhydryl oxidase 1-like Protein [Tribolium castaneum]|uniref:Sulfhydryl oxidase 1-like Protein n=1 Tax=Tribolium castaneum TaxID=7070 RepID=D6WVX5_TRICA|nr:Sulfhydryl oxidase 1-like Protein [Tribolium castaneum]
MIKALVLLLLPIAYCSLDTVSNDLFSPSDNVEILTGHNFKRLVEKSPTAWLVNFYSNTNVRSKEFSLIWKKLATEAKSWRDLVRVGVVDCSKEINKEICRQSFVLAYPTVKYFHERGSLGKTDFGYHVITSLKFDWLKRNVVNVFQNVISKSPGNGLQLQYPRGIVPTADPSQQKLFEGVKKNVKYVILVIEDFRQPLGAEMALHFHRTPQVAFKRTVLASGATLKHLLKLPPLPLPHIVITDRRNNVEIISHNINETMSMKWVLHKYLQSKGIKPIVVIPKKLTQ